MPIRVQNDLPAKKILEEENIFMMDSGEVLEMNEEYATINGKVPVGSILVDGLGVGDVGNVVLRDRQHLAQDGIVIVVLALDSENGYLLAGPDIQSRGFVYMKEADELMDEARAVLEEAVYGCLDRGVTDWGRIKSNIRDSLGNFIWKKTKRRPMILPIILDV